MMKVSERTADKIEIAALRVAMLELQARIELEKLTVVREAWVAKAQKQANAPADHVWDVNTRKFVPGAPQ